MMYIVFMFQGLAGMGVIAICGALFAMWPPTYVR